MLGFMKYIGYIGRSPEPELGGSINVRQVPLRFFFHNLHVSRWVVVKIRVPFWVPEKLGAVRKQGPKKGP